MARRPALKDLVTDVVVECIRNGDKKRILAVGDVQLVQFLPDRRLIKVRTDTKDYTYRIDITEVRSIL